MRGRRTRFREFHGHLLSAAGSLGLLAAVGSLAGRSDLAAPVHHALVLAAVLLSLAAALSLVSRPHPARSWRVFTRLASGSLAGLGAWATALALPLSALGAAATLAGGGSGPALPGGGATLAGAAVLGLASWFLSAQPGLELVVSCRPVWCSSPLPAAASSVTGLAVAACLLRLVSGVGPSTARLEVVAAALLLLATAAWVLLARRLERVFGPAGPVGYRLGRWPYGLGYWGGLALGFLFPAMLLHQGGGAAQFGAVLGAVLTALPLVTLRRLGEDEAPR